MRFHRALVTGLILLTAFLLSGCGLSLAEDVTPPPNYRRPTPAPETPQPDSTAFPLVPPDPVNGAAIYAQRCQQCHGPTGMGDGEQAGDLPNPPAPIGSAVLARKSRPVDWYHVVTVGNLERFMPGFKSLSDRERWDVVAYTYTLSSSPDELEQGKALYDENCAACHGERGQGDGAQAASLSAKPADWTDQERLAGLSAEEMAGVMSGSQEGHPSFAGALDEEQRYAVAAYIRSLSFAGPDQQTASTGVQPGGAEQSAGNTNQPGSADQPGGAEQPAEGAAKDPGDVVIDELTITGQVTNATPGGVVPDGLKVSIQAYSGMSPAFEVTGDVNEDGTYRVEGVEFNPGYVYFATTEANGLTFNSDILHGRDVTGHTVEMPIEIYDTTEDTSILRTERLHVFFDFTQPGMVQVVNLYIIDNPGDKIVVAPGQEKPVLQFSLPEGAENLQFQDGALGGRYVKTAGGFGDRMGISPGAGRHQILFAYSLPYDRKLSLEITPPLPVDAAIVMVPPGGIRLTSDQLLDAGQQDVQGMSFRMYQSTGSLPAGEPLSLSLSGNPGAAAAGEQDEMTYLVVGLAGFGLTLAGAGLWLYRQRAALRPAVVDGGDLPPEVEDESSESSESLLDAILALDDLNASGKLPKAAYQERRAELKARLAEALEREK